MRVLVVLILFLFFFSSVLFASGNLCSSGFSRFTETGRELQVTEQRFSSSRCQHGSESYDKAVLCVVFIFLVSPSDGRLFSFDYVVSVAGTTKQVSEDFLLPFDGCGYCRLVLCTVGSLGWFARVHASVRTASPQSC